MMKVKSLRERLHTAEHIIRTVVEESGYGRFNSVKIGADSGVAFFISSMDLSLKRQEIEEKVNRVIQGGLPVISYPVPREKADVVNLDLVPEKVREVTIYEISGFNRLACKGPHVQNTREVGRCIITSIKKSGVDDKYAIHYTVK